MFFQKIKNFFSYKSFLSRSGFLLIMIAIFLTIVSFVKGIQILIFIPAFIIAIFIYSLFELYFISKNISLGKYNDKNGNYLKIFIHKKYNSQFILGNKNEKGEIEFLEIDQGNNYKLEKEEDYNLILYIFGSFDIFRVVKNIDGGNPNLIGLLEDSYRVSEKYNQSHEISKIDTLKTSLSETPYIKVENHLQTDVSRNNLLQVISNIDLQISGNKNIKYLHILLILLGSIGLFIEWNDAILNSILILNILFIYLLRSKRGKLSQIYKNIILLATFACMLVLTYIQKDMSGPGSMFLLQILVNIYLFPKDFRNSFLYIFLLLFVFVAISLFSNQIRFIILFLIYIFVSIYLLFFISGDESFNEKKYKFGKKIPVKNLLKITGIIILLMFVLFFILPHGNKVEDKTEIIFNKNEGNVSGFNENITLENIGSIRQDNTKVIIIENKNESEIKQLGLEYFRGKRFDIFDGKKWISTLPKNYTRFTNGENNTGNIQQINIQFDLNGSKNIFFPAQPVGISNKNIPLISYDNDLTTLQSQYGINETINLEIDFLTSTGGNIIDNFPNQLNVSNNINPEINELFQEYFNSIPVEITNSPEKLTEFVKNQSGFSYSIEDISDNFEDFLYGSKKGHCEYFASTLMIVLQNYGFSPTLVSGFHGGEYNSLANSYIVRGKNAHSWVELYDENSQSWQVYDATPEIVFSLSSTFAKISNELINFYDYVDIKWYTYIANFTGEEQKKMYAKIINNKKLIGKYFLFIILFFIIIFCIKKSKKFIFLSKKEKILFLLSRYYKQNNNVISKIYQIDKNFATKLQEYVYANKGNISYFDIFILIYSEKFNKKRR